MSNSAPFVARLTEVKSIAVGGDVYTFLATGENTNGQYALFHIVIPPGGGPPPFINRLEDGMFYVLEGEITFYADGRKIICDPGTFLHFPKGSVHQFKNEGSETAKALVQVIPAGLEKFFEEVGQKVDGPSASPPPVTLDDISRLVAAAPRYGLEIVGNLENPSNQS